MRHRNKTIKLGRRAAARQALLRQLAVALIAHQRLTTTVTKAKVVRPFVEKIVTIGKTASLTNRRKVLGLLANEAAAKKVLREIAPRYLKRPGGYTRIVKLQRRVGDASPVALIEFI